jgi:hypothetical protein
MYLARYTKPKLTGIVVKEAVRCGKKNCRCTKGELHKWYYYLYYRSFEKGAWKLKKVYIKRNQVKYLRAKIRKIKYEEIASKLRISANAPALHQTYDFINGNMSIDDLLKTIHEIAQQN